MRIFPLIAVSVLCLSLSAHTNTASGQSADYEIDARHIEMKIDVACIGQFASEDFLTNVRDLIVNDGLSLNDALTALRPRLNGEGDINCHVKKMTYVPIYPLEIIDTVEFGEGDWQGADGPLYLVKSVVSVPDGRVYNRETLGEDVYALATDLVVKKSPR